MINLSNSTPAAPAGSQNVSWQQDASGNVSAYVGAPGSRKTTVAPTAGVVTLDCSQYDSFLITVNDAITNMVLTGATDGQEITILWAQDTTGHAVAGPTAAPFLLGNYSVTTTANKHSCYKFTYNSGDTNFYQIGANNM